MLYFNDNSLNIKYQCDSKRGFPLATEERTARLTLLVDPRKKAVFERLCAEEDATPSQVVRRLIRAYIEERTGKPWTPERAGRAAKPAKSARVTGRGSVR
jgi:hypothetical protein